MTKNSAYYVLMWGFVGWAFAIVLASVLLASPDVSNSDLDLPVTPPVYNPLPTQTPRPLPTRVGPPPEPPPRDLGPPPMFYGEYLDSEDDTVVYVIDVSGSMNTDDNGRVSRLTPSKLDRVKVELVKAIQSLPPNFEFNIIAYNCSTQAWSNSLQEATTPNKTSAIEWAQALQASGATGTGPATALALAIGKRYVILLTDGAPNCGAQGFAGHRDMIRLANQKGATIDVFGVQTYGRTRRFCQQVAGDSGGRYIEVY